MTKTVTEWRLLYGTSRKPIITVVPDETYAGMWRIQHPDGTLSDMVNLARAKDAATLIAARSVPNPKLLHWENRPDGHREAA